MFRISCSGLYSASEVLKSMNEHKHFHFTDKGYYFALILCAVFIAAAGFLFRQNAASKAKAAQAKTASVQVSGSAKSEAVSVMAPQELKVEKAAPAAVVAETIHQGIQTASPVDGSSIADYAMECLSFNETTRDWRTHDGVDLAAPEGTKVCAAAEGTVQSVYEDDAMGTTVVVRHGDGYVSKYASLANVCVAEGDYVYLGQALGQVSDSAILENAIGSHVHFSVCRNDEPMDPNEFLALE